MLAYRTPISAANRPATLWPNPVKGPLHPRPRRVAVCAKSDESDSVSGIVKTATGLIDKAADFVPGSVPRPAAKAGVGVAGALVVFWLVQKVISGVLTLVLFAGLGYYFLTKDVKDEDNSKKATRKPDLDDPLAEAKKIMDKYK